MTFQALECDLEGANGKLLFIEHWLDHHMSGLNTFFSFLPAQIPLKGSIESSTKFSHSSLQSPMPGTRAKRVASVTTIDARPCRRVNRATSNGSSRAEVDAEPDDHDASNGTSESNSVDLQELKRQFGESHNTSLPSLLMTLSLSQG
jgi:hypothetical protein